MKRCIRHFLLFFARCILNRHQVHIIKKECSRIRDWFINKSIKRQVIPKLNHARDELIANMVSILHEVSRNIIEFLYQRKVHGKDFEYFFSENSSKPTLYSSAYACMTMSMLGKIKTMTKNKKKQWVDFFDSYQSEADGLFYDPVIDSNLFRTGDWWGTRHLALHMISAYTDLGANPRYPFHFLEEYYDHGQIKKWLDSFDWSGIAAHDMDIDNKIMNIGCLMQYQRDNWCDKRAKSAVTYLQKYLYTKINPRTGMWGHYDVQNPNHLSRMVQFAYHLFPLFFYDNIQIQHPDKVIRMAMETQNELGGFSPKLNSSACEDIDSIDIIIRLSPLAPERKKEIDATLKKALLWVLCNQTEDGGFVFRLNESMIYGHREMASPKNCGGMFSTWFRTLTLAYLARYFSVAGFYLNSAPGLEN